MPHSIAPTVACAPLLVVVAAAVVAAAVAIVVVVAAVVAISKHFIVTHSAQMGRSLGSS